MIFVVACEIFSCGIQALSYSVWGIVPWPGSEFWPPAWGAQSLSHRTTREVPGKVQFSFQSQRKAVPKVAQTTVQLQ